jgi:hypothetical protein
MIDHQTKLTARTEKKGPREKKNLRITVVREHTTGKQETE